MKLYTSLALVFLTTMALCFMHCASTQSLTYDKRLLSEADEKFDKKRYTEALKIYQYIANNDAYIKLQTAKVALYKIGYTHMYFDNPNADPKAALQAFATFAFRYKEDALMPEVYTWIKLLKVLRSFEDQFDVAAERIRKLQSKSALANGSVDTLVEALQRCSIVKDSLEIERTALLKKIVDHEQTIVKMEKTK